MKENESLKKVEQPWRDSQLIKYPMPKNLGTSGYYKDYNQQISSTPKAPVYVPQKAQDEARYRVKSANRHKFLGRSTTSSTFINHFVTPTNLKYKEEKQRPQTRAGSVINGEHLKAGYVPMSQYQRDFFQ